MIKSNTNPQIPGFVPCSPGRDYHSTQPFNMKGPAITSVSQSTAVHPPRAPLMEEH